MKVTTGHAITPAMKAYADAVKACGDYSIANPTCAIKDNPFEPAIKPLHQAALGSVRVLMWCPTCTSVTPEITDMGRTACCGRGTVNLNDHRPASRRR
jgi:hypothetical protein